MVRSHQSVNWAQYFTDIRKQCPWSYAAWNKGLIDIQQWHREVHIEPLAHYQARMWIIDYPDAVVEAIAEELDSNDTENEWLFSYPGYGDYATPVSVLIQQNRAELNQIRDSIKE